MRQIDWMKQSHEDQRIDLRQDDIRLHNGAMALFRQTPQSRPHDNRGAGKGRKATDHASQKTDRRAACRAIKTAQLEVGRLEQRIDRVAGQQGAKDSHQSRSRQVRKQPYPNGYAGSTTNHARAWPCP